MLLIISTVWCAWLSPAYASFDTGNNIDISKLNIQGTGKLPQKIRVEKLNKLAENINTAVFNSRQQSTLSEFSSPAKLIEVEAMRTKLIDDTRATLSTTKNKVGVQSKLNKLEALSAPAYLEKVRTQLMDQKGMDTIAVRLDPNNQLTVAGNVKTVVLAYEDGITDPKLFEMLATQRGKGTPIQFEYTDLGLQSKDLVAIRQAVNDAKQSNLVSPDLETVKMLSPVTDPIIEENIQVNV